MEWSWSGTEELVPSAVITMFLLVYGSTCLQMLTCGRCNARQSCLLLAWAADFLEEPREAGRFILAIEVNSFFNSQCIFK